MTILNHIDDKTLVNFKETRRINVNFYGRCPIFWLGITGTQRYNCILGELWDVLKYIVRETPIEVVKELAMVVYQFSNTMMASLLRSTKPINLIL